VIAVVEARDGADRFRHDQDRPTRQHHRPAREREARHRVRRHVDTGLPGDRSQWRIRIRQAPRQRRQDLRPRHRRQKGGVATMITRRASSRSSASRPVLIYFTGTVMEEDCDGLCWQYIPPRGPPEARTRRHHRAHESEHLPRAPRPDGDPRRVKAGAVTVRRPSAATTRSTRSRASRGDRGASTNACAAIRSSAKGTVTISEVKSSSPSLCAVADEAVVSTSPAAYLVGEQSTLRVRCAASVAARASLSAFLSSRSTSRSRRSRWRPASSPPRTAKATTISPRRS